MRKLKRNLRRAFTLLELSVASVTSAVLVAGLASSIFIASQSLDVASDGTLVETRLASRIVNEINGNLQSAVSISELTDRSVTMSVPDRDGNGVPETIRYFWSGITGNPLYKVYNNGSATIIAPDVQSFSLQWISRMIEGVTSPPAVLFVSNEAPDNGGDGIATASSVEQERIEIIQGWGYDVTVISAQASQSNFDAVLEKVVAVYVPGTVNRLDLGTKLNPTEIGVVTESMSHGEVLGFYNSLVAQNSDQQTIEITNNTHFITEIFAGSTLQIASADVSISSTDSKRSIEAAELAVANSTTLNPSLLILDAGDQLANGSSAAGRRCQLPWGEVSFDVTALTNDGITLMRRAVQWATGVGPDTETVITGLQFRELTETLESSSTDNITVEVPPGYEENDLLLAMVVTDSNEGSHLAAAGSWTPIFVGEGGDADVTLGVWWKFASATEPTNYTFTWNSGEAACGWIMRFTGHNTTTPIHAVATDLGKSSSPNSPAVTTTVNDCLILRIGAFDDNDVSPGDTGVASHNTIVAQNSNSSGFGPCAGAVASILQPIASDTGNANFSLDGSEEYRTVTIAIEPAE